MKRTLAFALGCLIALLVAAPHDGPASAAPGSVTATDGLGLKRAVASYTGKVVVLNLWATWCGPCVEEFPDLVKLSRDFQTRDVVVIAASLDEPEDRKAVEEFARKQKAEFPVFLRKSGSPEAFVDGIDRKWPGAVPVTYIFGRSGKLAGKPMLGKRSHAEFSSAVENALKLRG